jgi:oxygen-independent coproporphyrinogen-3 oxidase
VKQYISSIEDGILPSDGEQLDSNDIYNEKIMTELRTREGLRLATISQQELSYCLVLAKPFIDDHLLEKDNERLRLTSKGLFVSDMIISQLMKV